MSHQPDNIFAGTQVVSLVEVRGTNQALVHPRGAVGVVTRTPTGEQNQFLVRFPDGFEASLTREQLDVLKHFKDRLGVAQAFPAEGFSLSPSKGERARVRGASDTCAAPNSNFNLEQCILYRCILGSRAYGLDTETSDTDRRGIYLAPAEMQWSLFGAPEQFEDNATQSCYWELQKFLIMALKANPNILECLYSPMVEKVTPLGEELLAIRQGFLSQMIFQTFNGYAMSQFKKSSRTFAIPVRSNANTPCIFCACYLPAPPLCAKAACPCASRPSANACSPSNAAKSPGPNWTPGAGNYTAISNAPSPKPNYPNDLTTKRQIGSSSKRERPQSRIMSVDEFRRIVCCSP
jgi:hypothetical protein